MKALILYFSQTGGTEKIAKAIQQGLEETGNDCSSVRIKDTNMEQLKVHDLIGIGCPTFYYREPLNVRHLIENFENLNGKHCFIFCTHGSIIGNTFYYMNQLLTEKGMIVIGAFDCYSASSLQFYPEIMHTAGHPDDVDLEEARSFGRKLPSIREQIIGGETHLLPKFELIENTWWARDSKMMTLDILRKISPKLMINVDKCTKCMTCQENCPVDAIDINQEPPEIQKEGCIFCWFCEKICPESAIEADWSAMRASTRPVLKKYVKILKEAEKKGIFRPLVEYEKIV
ncbi:MAG: EFR1 family ferrodoxin [Candidatus Helarchaeota archaeon]